MYPFFPLPNPAFCPQIFRQSISSMLEFPQKKIMEWKKIMERWYG